MMHPRSARLMGAYLLLLAASYATRSIRDVGPPEGRSVELVSSAARDSPIRIAYQQWLPSRPSVSSAETLILIHGSPGSSNDFRQLGSQLGQRFKVIAPDLPGFGHSTRELGEYSIRAHADDLIALLDALEVGRVHLVGFSMGGGVALHLADDPGDRVQSIVLLSSIGVQELELLGEYHINHTLHGLQLGAIWLLHRGIPHFGLLDGFPLDLPYARNFFDTDQRPLRSILETLELPTLIVHGKNDVLVPVSAAEEHHRLVPHSELQVLESDHFMVFRSSPYLSETIAAFISKVANNEAATRSAATPARIARSREDRRTWPPLSGISLAIALVLLAIATLVSEDLACIAAGLLVAHERLPMGATLVACALGIVIGDLGLYAMGRLFRPWLDLAPIRWFVSRQDLERSSKWFERRGGLVVLISRFLPGTRIPTYVAAGAMRTPLLTFAAFLIIPVSLWTPILVGSSMIVGERIFSSFEAFRTWALPTFAGLLVAMWLILATIKVVTSFRSRRRLAGWWRRRVCWEYWPRWLFYPPVVVYVLWLSIRFRSATLFTSTNPGLPAGGGLLGESKTEILDLFGPEWIARYRRLPIAATAAERMAAVAEFMSENVLTFPLVLKPDVGHRGDGVVIARTQLDVEHFCSRVTADAQVQEYVSGPELGLFYIRQPSSPNGFLFSITDKKRPTATGDGRSSVEHLILASPRGAAKADQYLAENHQQLDRVPEDGEVIELLDVGSHSRGTIFLDGRRYETAELLASCDRLALSCSGFYFGRFDVRGKSFEAIGRGEFKVLELNGVGSEATHIYDPGLTIWDAYRVLFTQWRLAFEIGDANRTSGVEPRSLRELCAMVARHRQNAIATDSVRSATRSG